MSLDDAESHNREAMHRERDELVRGQISDSETYDRSILTLSSSFLGFSVAFIHFAVRGVRIEILWVLIASWSFYCLSIFAVLASILVTQWVRRKMVEHLADYYERDDSCLFGFSKKMQNLQWVNVLSGATFAVATLFLVVFASVNLERGVMPDTPGGNGQPLEKGAPINMPYPRPQPTPQPNNTPAPNPAPSPQKL